MQVSLYVSFKFDFHVRYKCRCTFLLSLIFTFDASELSLNVSFKFDLHVRCKYRFTFLLSLIYTFDASIALRFF